MTRAKTHSLRYITRIDQDGYHSWMVRVGLATEHCIQEMFTDSHYGGKLKSKQASIQYRDEQEELLDQIYGLSFDLGYNPRKESVYLNSCVKESGTYWSWIGSVWEPKKKRQHKKQYSVNKYGAREARRLAYKWRDLKREELL